MLNSVATWIRETFTHFLPVVLPILGLKVGVIYVATLWFGTLVTAAFAIVVGRLLFEGSRGNETLKESGKRGI